MKHLFLTGEIGVGKSTLLRRLLAELSGLRLGGFYSVKVADVPGALGSVYLAPPETEPVCTAEYRILVRGGPGKPPERWPQVFETAGLSLLRDAEKADLILMDELGKAEAAAPRFCGRVLELLAGETPVFGVLRLEGETPLQRAVRSHPQVELVRVTAQNRDELAPLLLPRLRTMLN